MLAKLSTACYAIRIVTSLMAEETLRMMYFSYVHSIITYGTIFEGNLPHSNNIFKIQKQII